MLMTAFLAKRRNYPRSPRWPTAGELWRDAKPAIPAMAAPVILIAGMLAGFFTPTEIASVTVIYTLLISAFFYRELTWAGLYQAARETIIASSAILMIVAVAALFGWILSWRCAAEADGGDAVDLARPLHPAAAGQHPAADRGDVPRLDDGHPRHRADHREAADGRGRRSGPSRHGRGVQT